jgi:hypothetical protein
MDYTQRYNKGGGEEVGRSPREDDRKMTAQTTGVSDRRNVTITNKGPTGPGATGPGRHVRSATGDVGRKTARPRLLTGFEGRPVAEGAKQSPLATELAYAFAMDTGYSIPAYPWLFIEPPTDAVRLRPSRSMTGVRGSVTGSWTGVNNRDPDLHSRSGYGPMACPFFFVWVSTAHFPMFPLLPG